MVNLRLFPRRIFLYFLLTVLIGSCDRGKTPARILIFSKTEGFRHIEGIEAGTAAIQKLAMQHGVMVDTTEDAEQFTEENLKQYDAVVFLNVSGEVFDQDQRFAFQRYIESGGGFLAVHGATDAEREWPWYGRLIGAYFNSHPPGVRKATYIVTDRNNPATDSLPARWERMDELYNFQQVDSSIHVLISIDEKSYEGGNMGEHHPMVWYHDFDGGRSFYISMGHTNETYSEPLFLKLLWGGLSYAIGDKNRKRDYSKAIPEENRFTRNVLMEKLDEPMQMAFSKEGQVFFAERRGNIIRYDPATKNGKVIGTIPVSSRYEDGLLGLATDPAFTENNWLYVFYTSPMATEFHVSRFTLDKTGNIDPGSEKILLKIPKDILDGSHTGGGLLFDPRGNGDLYITVGDNTSPRATGFAPIDERDGRMDYDAQRSASNTNDLRGKILRIHPEPDGTYTIPAGNLFPKGMAKTRPEIYTMGHRQPWRISIDSKTGWLHEGEVGPDAEADSADRGPRGYDEFNIIKGPGNFGWPYFLGDNEAYHAFDFMTGKTGPVFNQDKPENHSRYNTGLTALPPAQKAFLWYPYAVSKEFPLMTTGARCATGGPVFHRDDYPGAKNAFPAYYEGKWFITDWIRGWILAVTTDKDGRYESMEPFMPGYKFTGPLDMQFGPDGSLYVLEYGSGWFQANDDARLTRIDYNGGNRRPVAEARADRTSGALPLTVKLSAAGTKDYDAGDMLSYKWKISLAGKEIKTLDGPGPVLTLSEAGTYQVQLTATDQRGASGTAELKLEAGNEAPVVNFQISRGNQTFFFPNTTVGYAVTINDREDGSIRNDSNALVSVNYLPQGPVQQEPEERGHAMAADAFVNIGAQLLINGNDCYSCHAIDKKSAGPAFREIAERYQGDASAAVRLSKKIISGGSGNWGQASMSAHPNLSADDAKRIASYILTMTRNPPKPVSLPLAGTYHIGTPPMKDNKGIFLFRASYTDKGNKTALPLTGTGSTMLRSPVLLPSDADEFKGYMRVKLVAEPVILYMMYGAGAYLGFRNIDLTGIRSVRLGMSPSPGTFVELRLDSPEGELIGSTDSSSKKRSPATGAEIKIRGITGKRNVYFVCKNPGAGKNDFMLTYTRIEFKD